MKTHRIIPGLLSAIYAITMITACAGLEDPEAQADPGGDAELGTAVSELAYDAQRIQVEDTTQLAASIFGGATDSRTIGGPCRDGTTRDTVQVWGDYASISGSWSSWSWVSSSDHDCTAVITMNVGAGHWDNFHWRLYTRAYNLAVGTTASQSSTLSGAGPWRAIDGNTDGNWWDGSVTHTNYEATPWWQVDLGVSHAIGTVIVYNRTDCCSERLSDFDVWVGDGTNWTRIGGIIGQAPPRTVFTTTTPGRLVKVQLRGTEYLSLAEVQVYVQ
jgi:hypothetical protein